MTLGENNGPFFTPEELVNVKGIGPKTLEKNLENIIVRFTRIFYCS